MTSQEIPHMDIFDKLTAHIRREILVDMRQNDQIDSEQFTQLFDAAVRPDQVDQSREAFLTFDNGPDTPVGRLSTLWCKLPTKTHK